MSVILTLASKRVRWYGVLRYAKEFTADRPCASNHFLPCARDCVQLVLAETQLHGLRAGAHFRAADGKLARVGARPVPPRHVTLRLAACFGLSGGRIRPVSERKKPRSSPGVAAPNGHAAMEAPGVTAIASDHPGSLVIDGCPRV